MAENSAPWVISLNGFSGVGKMTVARALVRSLVNARLIDNHTYMDAAFALFPVGSPEWRTLTATLREKVYDAAEQAEPGATLVFTNVLYDGRDDRDIFEQIARVAQRRGCPLLAVTLTCSREAHRRRLTRRRTPNKLTRWRRMEAILDVFDLLRLDCGDVADLEIDTTEMTADETAARIAAALPYSASTVEG